MSLALASSIGLLAIILMLILSPAILYLCGFFESRKNGTYKFISSRFLANIAIAAIASIVMEPAIAQSIVQLSADGESKGLHDLRKMQMAQLFFQEYVGEFFPEIKKSNDCYTRAISSWIQKNWTQDYRATTCKESLCAYNQEQYMGELRNRLNPQDDFLLKMLAKELYIKDKAISSTFPVAACLYTRMNSVSGAKLPRFQTNINIGNDEEIQAEYVHFIKECDKTSVASWFDINQIPQTDLVSLCMGNCP